MILFPYRAQIRLHKLPVVTIAVAVICLLVYVAQSQSEGRVEAHAARVCATLAAKERAQAEAQAGDAGEETGAKTQPPAEQRPRGLTPCEFFVLHVHFDPNPEKHLAWHLEHLKKRGDEEGAQRLAAQYRAFAASAPVLLTARLWHDRSRFDPIGMITSAFAHGGWEHVIFNLIFFFAFAAAVELILGPVLFAGSIVALSLGLGGVDHIVALWQGDPVPSLGLSGVVTGMLALFVYFLPHAKIRFFFWFMLSVGTIGIPAWLVALWYLGWDLYYQLMQVRSGVNFVAHLAGGAMGFLLGVLLFRAKRHWAQDIVVEKPDLTQDESWFAKMNTILVAPAVAGFAFLAGLFLIAYVVLFVGTFWVQLLLAAPAAAAGYHLWRTRRRIPDYEHFRRGEQALNERRFEEARKHLEPLASKNYPRALHALGDLHSMAHGLLRDEALAFDYYRRAAERGHAPASNRLGVLYADGRGVGRSALRAAECYQKAAEGGVPDAAMSLAYLYERGADKSLAADRDKAIEWYYRAGAAFHKAGRREDAEMVVRHLEALARDYPAVLGLLAKLKGLLAATKV